MVDSIFLFFYCFIYTFPILQTLQIWALEMSHANFLFYTKLFMWSRKCNLCTLTLVKNIDLDTKWPKLSNIFLQYRLPYQDAPYSVPEIQIAFCSLFSYSDHYWKKLCLTTAFWSQMSNVLLYFNRLWRSMAVIII